jgi:hypothetical protein
VQFIYIEVGGRVFWILTKPGTFLDLKKIWNPIDFQGQRARSQGLIFRRGDTPRFALVLKMYSLIGRYLKKRFCYPISVFLTTACNTSSCFMFTPRCFPFRKHFVCFEFYSSSGESHRWIRGSSITLGNRIFCFWFCDDYFSEKKTKYH